MVFGIEIVTEANVCLVIAAAFNKDLTDCVTPEQGSQTFCISIKALIVYIKHMLTQILMCRRKKLTDSKHKFFYNATFCNNTVCKSQKL